jgi:hypothetical protein
MVTKAAKATEETEETESTEKVEVDKSTVMSWIKEALSDITGGGETPVEETTTDAGTDVEEIESPRQQESRMRREVEGALKDLHIHVEQPKVSEGKKEVEETPGKKPFLERFWGLS